MANDLFVPVNSDPSRSITVSLDGVPYILSTRWNFVDEAWYLDIESVQDGMLVRGIKLIVGIELLQPYALVQLGELFLVDTQEGDKDPTEESLGDRHQIIYVVKENRGTFI